MLDAEIKQGDKEIVRAVFERVTKGGSLKIRKAKWFFKRWAQYEEKEGDEKSLRRVKLLAEEYVREQKGEKDVKGEM